MTKKRIGYFDIAKCIAILFIVVGHTGIIYPETLPGGMPQKLVHFAFTFHLPVFFIASGYFFKLDTVLSKQFFKKAWKNILTPYWVTCVIILIATTAMAAALGTSLKAELARWIPAALYGAGAENPGMLVPVYRIGGIWFLLALFWAQIIILAAERLPKPGLWICGLFALGWLASQCIELPWSIQSGICAAPFVYAGALARKYQILEKDGPAAAAVTVGCAILWLIYIVKADLDMSFAVFALPNGLLDLAGSFAAAYVVSASADSSSTMRRSRRNSWSGSVATPWPSSACISWRTMRWGRSGTRSKASSAPPCHMPAGSPSWPYASRLSQLNAPSSTASPASTGSTSPVNDRSRRPSRARPLALGKRKRTKTA